MNNAHHNQIEEGRNLNIQVSSLKTNQPLEFSLQNGLAVQKVFENAQRYGLRPQDESALIQGRQSMIQYTRWGFFLGATLAPLPLFRGKYAIKNLPKLAPLIDPATQRPNPELIKARLIWLGKSVVATTVGSGIGTWLGFELGLIRMNQRLKLVDGCKERVINAFEQARKELSLNPIQPIQNNRLKQQQQNIPFRSTGQNQSIAQNELGSSPGFIPDEGFYTQESLDEIDSQQKNKPENIQSFAKPDDNSQSPDTQIATPPDSNISRWEELRRSRNATQSTWESIRQKQKHNLNRSTNQSSSAVKPHETSSSSSSGSSFSSSSSASLPSTSPEIISQESFEDLLERERKLSSGEIRSRS